MATTRILQELIRRNVIRAGIGYVVSGWLLAQIAAVLLPAIDAPWWMLRALIIALAAGLPAVLVFSWFFEFTASGIKRTGEVAVDESAGGLFDRRVDFVIIGVLAGALALSLYGNLRRFEAPPEPVSVLIADLENETGNELFSGVLEESLRVGLEGAPFLEAFSRRSAASIAMPDSGDATGSLDAEAASVVALREGINIVIAGAIRRTERGLSISVRGIAPGDQRELFRVEETARTDADVLQAIAAISTEVRLELGDTEKPRRAGEYESFVVANLEAAAEYLEAQDLQRDRKLEDAIVHYENALRLDPEFARAYAGLALTEQYLGRTEAAGRHWQEALSRLDTLDERGRLRTLGNYYTINQRDYDKALETYERLVERYPADNVAHNNLAVAAFYALNFERALKVGREIAGRYPDHSGYRANLALYAMYASQFDEAADVARRLIEDDPTVAYAFLVLALTSAAAGDLEAAEAAFRRMAELDQFGRSIGAEGLADLAMYRGDFKAALAVLDAAIADEIAQGASHTAALKQVVRAEALLQLNEAEKARDAIESALRDAGGDPAILVPASIVLTRIGEADRAVAIAAEMSQSSSRSQRAYAEAVRAHVAHMEGDLTQAIEHANAALEAADLWLVRFIRARILLRSERLPEAAADLNACLQRRGEGLAVFLNDRPSLRLLREFESTLSVVELDGQIVATEAATEPLR